MAQIWQIFSFNLCHLDNLWIIELRSRTTITVFLRQSLKHIRGGKGHAHHAGTRVRRQRR